jgi:uncharacterized protein (DUF433 family)
VASDPRPLTDDELIERWIEFLPGRPGRDRASLRESGVEVWALVAYYRGFEEDIERVAHDYDIPVGAVRAALAYYARERRFIDARLTLLRDD